MRASNEQTIPTTATHPVTDTYHGTTVVDAYRWLEDATDPAVRDWTVAQNRYTRTVLDAIPARSAIAQRLHALYTAKLHRLLCADQARGEALCPQAAAP